MLGGFGQTLDRLGKGDKRENLPGASRREMHLRLFRAFVKSTISDLGHAEFGEYHIGHKGSMYYRKSEKEKMEIFKKIEPSWIMRGWKERDQTLRHNLKRKIKSCGGGRRPSKNIIGSKKG